MTRDAHIEVLEVSKAPRHLRERGMLAWLRLRVDTLVVDGVSLREGRDGLLRLSFPVRTDRDGQRHSVVRPIDDGERIRIEGQVLRALEGRAR